MKLTRTLATIAIVAIAAAAYSQSTDRGRGTGRGPGRGHGGMGRGRDASLAHDQDVFHELLRRHADIKRTVTELPNGVLTRTTSGDTEIAAKIRDHVAAMHDRVKEGRPVRRWDPLFAELFTRSQEIKMRVTEIPGGVEVTETSKSPEVVALIQAHARVVSGFVAEGFDEAQRAHQLPGADSTSVPQANQATTQRVTTVSAKLDRTYIPALALTNQGKAGPARKAIKRLKAQLPQLVALLEEEAAAVSGLLSGVAEIVQAADALVDSGETHQAHEALEPIRDLLTKRRREVGVSYPLDVLSDYHAVMEAIVKPAKAAGPNGVDQRFRARVAEQAVEASRVWAIAEQTDFSLTQPIKRWPSQDAVTKDVAAVRASITKLNNALRSDDPQAVRQLAVSLKPPFAKLYMSFGDFTGLRPSDRGTSFTAPNGWKPLPKEAPSPSGNESSSARVDR